MLLFCRQPWQLRTDSQGFYLLLICDNRYYENLPYGWKICSVSDIAYLRTGATFDKANVLLSNKNEGIRVLRGGNISTYKIDFQIDDIFIPTAIVNPSIHVQQYDIITPAVTSLENIGKMARVFTKPTSNYTVGGFVYLLTPLFYNDTFSKFLLYQFTSTWFIRQLQAIAKKSGAAFYNINKTKFNGLPVFIPPLEEQARIVNRVEELFAQIDIIDQNQAEIDTLYEEFRKRTLTLAIQGKLVPQGPNDEPASVLLERIRAEKKAKLGKKYVDSYIYKGDDNCYYEHITGRAQDEPVEVPFDIPDNWEWSKIKYIADTQTGTTPSTSDKSNFGDYISFVKPGDLVNGRILYNREMLSERGLNNGRLIPSNSVIMVCIGGSTGKCALTDRDISCNQQINTASPCKWVLPQYLFFFMTSDYFYKTVRANATGTATPIINRSTWENLVIPIPPLAEQKRIVAKINEIFAML